LSEEDTSGNLIVPSALIAPYRLIGDRLTGVLPFFESLRGSLMRADLKIASSVYVAYTLFFSAVGFVTAFTATLVLEILLLMPITTSLLLAFAFGLLSWLAIFVMLYAYPSLLSDSRKRHLEEELPYLAVHMAVLSQAGIPPERIFRSISMIGSKGLKSIASEEAKNVVSDVSVLGTDIISAMKKNARKSASNKFAELLNGLVSVTQSGGDMTKYFLSAARGYMDEARIAGRQLSEALGNVAEIYVALMVVLPLVVMIMLAVMGIMGGTLAGISVIAIMYVVSYLVVPSLAMIVLLFLDSMMPPR
jgi:flagellar protein FlaJ